MRTKMFSLMSLIFALAVFFSCNTAQTDGSGTQTTTTTVDSLFLEKFQKGVFPSVNYAETTDTTIFSSSPDSNFGANLTGTVGTAANGAMARYLVKFNINGYIPKSAIIKKVSLLVYFTLGTKSRTENGSDKVIYGLTRNFSEGTGVSPADGATWNTYDGTNTWISSGGDYAPSSVSSTVSLTSTSGSDYYTFDITPATVQAWLNDSTKNFGLLIKNAVEVALLQYSQADSNDSQTIVQRPMLLVYYDLP